MRLRSTGNASLLRFDIADALAFTIANMPTWLVVACGMGG